MALDINLRDHLYWDPNVSNLTTTIVQDIITDKDWVPDTRIWYQRRSKTAYLTNDGDRSIGEERFDIECISPSIETSNALADAVRDCLDGIATKWGNYYVRVEVEDQEDEYEPYHEGFFVAALEILIIYNVRG